MSKKTKIEQIQKDVIKELSEEKNRQFGYKKTELLDKMVKLGHAKIAVSKVINELIEKDTIVILEGEGESMVIGIKEPDQPEETPIEEQIIEAEFKEEIKEPEPTHSEKSVSEEPQTEPETTQTTEQTGQDIKPVTEEPLTEKQTIETTEPEKQEQTTETIEQPEETPVEEPEPEEDEIDESLIKQEKSIEEKRKDLEAQLKKLNEDGAKIFIKREGLKRLPEGIRADYQLLKSQKNEAETLKKELRDMQKIVDDHLESWRGLAKQAGVSSDTIDELEKQILGRSECANGDLEKIYSEKKGIIPDTIKTLRLYPSGIRRAEVIKEICYKFGYNKGAVNRVLSETSKYVHHGTLIQRGAVILEGDRVRLSEKYLKE